MTQLTHDTIIEAFINCDFIMAKTARKLRTTAAKLRYIIKNDAELASKLDNAAEDRVDLAEEGLQELIRQGSFPAIKFFLEQKGKKKGYGNDTNINVRQVGESEAIMEALNRKYADDL